MKLNPRFTKLPVVPTTPRACNHNVQRCLVGLTWTPEVMHGFDADIKTPDQVSDKQSTGELRPSCLFNWTSLAFKVGLVN